MNNYDVYETEIDLEDMISWWVSFNNWKDDAWTNGRGIRLYDGEIIPVEKRIQQILSH